MTACATRSALMKSGSLSDSAIVSDGGSVAADVDVHERATRHAADRQMIHLDVVAAAAAAKTAERQRALRGRDDLSVGPAQRRRQQHAALQAARVADRRRGHVDARAVVRVGRQLGGDEHRGDVLDLHLRRRHRHAELLEHVGQRLRREDRLPLVAGLVQADDQAVADDAAWR